MPLVAPFRALTYAPRLRPELDRLVAPPYDVISETERERLASHRDNIVHLDLPKEPGGGDDLYARAAARLRGFVQEAILVREEHPAYYLLEQRYRDPSGAERLRRGFFARVRLEALNSGVIIPHERTLEKPRADRQNLLAATRTHLSAVFMLHADPEGQVASLLGRHAGEPAFLSARDRDGTAGRLVRLADPETIRRLTDHLASAWALIADGHHRYESALAYREARRAAGAADAEHVLAFLCSLRDPGLSIFPIHRLVHHIPAFDPAGVRRRLSEFFQVSHVDGEARLAAEVSARTGRAGVFGMVLSGETQPLLLEWREGKGLEGPEMATIPEALRRLDVILLHRLLLEGILGIGTEAQAKQTHLDYVKDGEALFEAVRRGGAQIGLLLNPTRIEQVIDVSRSGLRLPQKSTYFYPKVPSGFVLDPLDAV